MSPSQYVLERIRVTVGRGPINRWTVAAAAEVADG